MTPAMLAEVLSQAAGSALTEADILADVRAGAPALPDGRIPLLRYIGWLYHQVINGAD